MDDGGGVPGEIRRLRAALRVEELDDALTTTAHAERARKITVEMVKTQAYVAAMSEARDDAVRLMRADGASYDQVAQTLKISKSRAQQICRRLDRAAGQGV